MRRKDLIWLVTKVLVEGFGELVQSRGNLEPLLEDPLLPLDLDGLRPLHEPGQVPLRRQCPSDPELLRTLLEQRVRNLLLKRKETKQFS